MIAILNGRMTETIADSTVIDVNGVGYGVILPGSTAAKMQPDKTYKLYIYEHIKEDAHLLYGFSNLLDKQLFEQLLRVKNVGPKVAMAILDIGDSDTVRYAIASGDVQRLQTAKGVGRRAAEQVVVELRDKMGLAVGVGAEDVVSRGAADLKDEAVQALIALGYSDADAALALQSISSDLPVEDRVKQALRGK
jgi:Holliday junction DNA helicase RuvA